MRKTRILSMLLAMVMTASALPVSTSAASGSLATPFMTELLKADLSKPGTYQKDGLTASQVKISNTNAADNSNTYLRIGARQAANVRYYFKVTFKNDTTVKAGDKLSLTFSLRSPIDGVEVTETAWRFEHATGAIFTATNEWATYTTENVVVQEKNGSKYIQVGIFGKNDIKQVAPLEIDNVVMNDASQKVVYRNDFESADTQSAMGSYNLMVGGVNQPPVTETSYLHVNAVADGETIAATNYNGTVTYNPDMLLEPGSYTLSFDSRMSCFFINSDHNSAEYEYEYLKKLGTETDRTKVAPDKGVRVAELGDGYNTNTWGTPEATSIYHILYKNGNSISQANYRDVEVTLKAGDKELVAKTVEIDDTWSKYEYEFDITESTTIDALSFGGTGLAYDNDAFDIMNVALTLEGSETNLFEADLSDPANYSKQGLTVSQGNAPEKVVVTNTNTYLRSNARQAAKEKYHLKVTFKNNTTVKSGDKLSLTFSLRSPIDGVEVEKTEWRFEHASGTIFAATNEWSTYTTENVVVQEKGGSKYIEVGFFGKNDIKQVAPIEIDNIVLKDAGGTSVYANDFESMSTQSDMGTYLWMYNGVNTKPVTETSYLRVNAVAKGSSVADTEYDGKITYNPDILLVPGRYIFTFDSRMSYFFTNSDHNSAEYEYEYLKKLGTETDRTKIEPDKGVRAAELGDGYNTNTWGTPEATSIYHILYKNGNSISHTNYRYIDVALKADSKDLIADSVKVDDTWATYSYNIVIDEAVKLNNLSFGGTGLAYDNDAFDIMNVSLMLVEPFDVDEETVENYIGDVTTTNVGVTETLEKDAGYIYVTQRAAEGKNTTDYLKFTANTPISKGQEYFVSYDIKSESNGDSNGLARIRTTVNVPTEFVQNQTVSKYIDDIKGSTLETTYFVNKNGLEWMHNEVKDGEQYTFLGHFVPTEDATKLEVKFNRGDTPTRDNRPIIVDNFRVWYEKNGKQFFIYNNDFNTAADYVGISGNGGVGTEYAIEHVLIPAYTAYTPANTSEAMSVTYNFLKPSSAKTPSVGEYSFNTTAKLADEGTAAAANVTVTFNYSDGKTESETFRITKNWTKISMSRAYTEDSAELESVTVTFVPGVSVQIMDSLLTVMKSDSESDCVNVGIIMVLLKKRQQTGGDINEGAETEDNNTEDPWGDLGID